jgi:hypothetical protein
MELVVAVVLRLLLLTVMVAVEVAAVSHLVRLVPSALALLLTVLSVTLPQ